MRADNQRRGRHPGADRAGRRRSVHGARRGALLIAARPLRRRAALRRRHDHAGDLGALARSRASRSRRRASSPTSSRSPIAILIVLFFIQSRGTAGVGARLRPGDAASGSLTLGGARHRAGSCRDPDVLAARQPALRGRASSPHNRIHGFLVARLGLPCGHRRRGALRRHGPLRQRADPHRLVRARAARRCCSTTSARARCCSSNPDAVDNPFFELRRRLGAATRWSCLATVATVIASQALISGAFSLTRQAVQLGYLPRVDDRPHLARASIGPDLHPRRSTGS